LALAALGTGISESMGRHLGCGLNIELPQVPHYLHGFSTCVNFQEPEFDLGQFCSATQE
jgi:hypothetical protein